MPVESTVSAGTPVTRSAAWAILIAVLALGIYLRNPAVALLGGLAIRLTMGVNPVPGAGKLGGRSLQTAIVLLGFTLGIDRMVDVSADYGVIVAIYVLATLGLGWMFARVVRGDRTEAALLSSGTAICGGTAIATLAPLMGARGHQFAVATALVFLLNIVALLTFPYIGTWLGLSQEVFGAWVALAVHDTSSVVATAALYGNEAAEVATTVKLGRTLWLIPVAFIVSLVYRQGEAKLRIPGFVLLFVGAAFVSSLIELPGEVIGAASWVSKALLVVALAMIGLQIERDTLRQISGKVLVFGLGLWLAMIPLALFLVVYL